MNFKKITLQSQFIEYLKAQPKQGKDIQIVDVYFKDGSILKQRVVSYNTYLQGSIGEKITIEDITEIKIASENGTSKANIR
jgi:hypothetical protein